MNLPYVGVGQVGVVFHSRSNKMKQKAELRDAKSSKLHPCDARIRRLRELRMPFELDVHWNSN